MSAPIVISGWTILAHPLFLAQLERLIAAVALEKQKDPKNYRSKANAKLLAAIYKIAFRQIPSDPSLPRYRQGGTLGDNFKHWFREKFGNGRFRLFFRYDSSAKIIMYAWVNDSETLRTYGARTDAYAVFSAMLSSGNPPDNWAKLEASCKDPDVLTRLSQILDEPT